MENIEKEKTSEEILNSEEINYVEI